MKKENVLFAIIGVLLGFIVGFFFANTVNQRGAAQQVGRAGQLPPDHPPVGDSASPEMLAAVAEAEKKAAAEPDDFEAQARAGEANYQAQRHEEAINFWSRANRLRPDDYRTIVNLGNANFDAGHFETAEKWYAAALLKQPDDVNVRTDMGLTFMFRPSPDYRRAAAEFRRSLERDPAHPQTLQNLTVALARSGDPAGAEAALARLEAASPDNPALQTLRAEIERHRRNAPTQSAPKSDAR